MTGQHDAPVFILFGRPSGNKPCLPTPLARHNHEPQDNQQAPSAYVAECVRCQRCKKCSVFLPWLWVQLWVRGNVEFSWDEPKRNWVLAERGIDFLRVAFALFDGRPLLTVPTPRDDEERFLSVGPIEGRFFAVVWTWRDGAVRIITARRARDAEEKRYRALYG